MRFPSDSLSQKDAHLRGHVETSSQTNLNTTFWSSSQCNICSNTQAQVGPNACLFCSLAEPTAGPETWPVLVSFHLNREQGASGAVMDFLGQNFLHWLPRTTKITCQSLKLSSTDSELLLLSTSTKSSPFTKSCVPQFD